MILNVDISNFSDKLFEQSISLFTCFNVFVYNTATKCIEESVNADNIRLELSNKKQILPLWLSFSTGYELLFKAVLTKRQALNIKLGTVSKRSKDFKQSNKLEEIKNVYKFVFISRVSSSNNHYIRKEIINKKIIHLHDFSTDTLGGSIGKLKVLEDNDVITTEERNFLSAASYTLLDIRRNVDAHTFYYLTVTREINGDLTKVYLPAINLLIDIYFR